MLPSYTVSKLVDITVGTYRVRVRTRTRTRTDCRTSMLLLIIVPRRPTGTSTYSLVLIWRLRQIRTGTYHRSLRKNVFDEDPSRIFVPKCEGIYEYRN